MLAQKDVVATIAVRDLAKAKKFYGQTLGLSELATEEGEVLGFASGGSRLMVYRSEFAGSNRATAATWLVGDEVDEIVRALKARGVTFEHYDMPHTTREGDVHVAGATRVAWFKDPEGNILSIVNGTPAG
ncbi:MAG TPA: VOC family protein [Thermoanaerobaculia bacterium]|nr:VOC family protein [Thermoanaerobaculia bacterium]